MNEARLYMNSAINNAFKCSMDAFYDSINRFIYDMVTRNEIRINRNSFSSSTGDEYSINRVFVNDGEVFFELECMEIDEPSYIKSIKKIEYNNIISILNCLGINN